MKVLIHTFIFLTNEINSRSSIFQYSRFFKYFFEFFLPHSRLTPITDVSLLTDTHHPIHIILGDSQYAHHNSFFILAWDNKHHTIVIQTHLFYQLFALIKMIVTANFEGKKGRQTISHLMSRVYPPSAPFST